MRIRRATEADLPAVMAMVRRVVPAMVAAGNRQWNESYPNLEVLGRDVALGQLWVAETEAGVVGVAAITTQRTPEYAGVGWDLSEPALEVHRLAVDPAAQGMGVASALMAQAEPDARERGIRVLRVDTNSENAATRRLFPKLGYRMAGEIAFGSRPGLRFLCYEKRLD